MVVSHLTHRVERVFGDDGLRNLSVRMGSPADATAKGIEPAIKVKVNVVAAEHESVDAVANFGWQRQERRMAAVARGAEDDDVNSLQTQHNGG